MNRRIRNRTYGGVGGRRTQVRLLPDGVPGMAHSALSGAVPVHVVVTG